MKVVVSKSRIERPSHIATTGSSMRTYRSAYRYHPHRAPLAAGMYDTFAYCSLIISAVFSEGDLSSVRSSNYPFFSVYVNIWLLSHLLQDHWGILFLNLVRMFLSISNCASTEKRSRQTDKRTDAREIHLSKAPLVYDQNS